MAIDTSLMRRDDSGIDRIYRDRANGRWEYFVYSDFQRFYVDVNWAWREINAQRATLHTIG